VGAVVLVILAAWLLALVVLAGVVPVLQLPLALLPEQQILEAAVGHLHGLPHHIL
tara:strand:- start:273 stop:437 length:165 start_codon:yes stop_codon:yes gene_type:complete